MTTDANTTHTANRIYIHLRYQCQGRQRAQTGPQIADLVGCSLRELQHAITALRDAAEPIGSDGNGYWWCVTLDEIDAVLASLRARAIGQIQRVRRLRDARRKLAGERMTQATFLT